MNLKLPNGTLDSVDLCVLESIGIFFFFLVQKSFAANMGLTFDVLLSTASQHII